MTETEIAQLNERVARLLGYELNPNYRTVRWWHPRKNYSEDLPPDFYHNIRLVGEMTMWLIDKGYEIQSRRWTSGIIQVVLLSNSGHVQYFHDGTLPAALCRAIDAVAKEDAP